MGVEWFTPAEVVDENENGTKYDELAKVYKPDGYSRDEQKDLNEVFNVDMFKDDILASTKRMMIDLKDEVNASVSLALKERDKEVDKIITDAIKTKDLRVVDYIMNFTEEENLRYYSLIIEYYHSVISKTKAEVENQTQPQKVEADDTMETSEYEVQQDDWLSKIAQKYDGVSWQEIAKINNISDPYIIHPGQKIQIPAVWENIPQIVSPELQSRDFLSEYEQKLEEANKSIDYSDLIQLIQDMPDNEWNKVNDGSDAMKDLQKLLWPLFNELINPKIDGFFKKHPQYSEIKEVVDQHLPAIKVALHTLVTLSGQQNVSKDQVIAALQWYEKVFHDTTEAMDNIDPILLEKFEKDFEKSGSFSPDSAEMKSKVWAIMQNIDENSSVTTEWEKQEPEVV